jgi:hypothetical protein
MLGFVPQPNLHWSYFLGLTEQYWDEGDGGDEGDGVNNPCPMPNAQCPIPLKFNYRFYLQISEARSILAG